MKRIDRPTNGEVLVETPYWTGLSSGLFGYPAHLGAMQAVNDYGLETEGLSGSSSGGFAACLVASGLEPCEAMDKLVRVQLKDFSDWGLGWGAFKGELFRNLVEEMLLAKTFEEAPIHARVSVFDIRTRSTEVIASGNMALAVQTTCAIPPLFHPVNGKSDGGIKDYPGVAGVPAGARLLHIDLSRKEPYDAPSSSVLQLHMPDLPRVTPLHLHRSQEAYEQARRRMAAFLNTPVNTA